MFGSKLEEAVRAIKGGHSAILMGFDGIPVDMFTTNEDVDIETVGMEFSVLLKEVRKAAEMLDAGDAEELTVRTDKLVTVLRIINDEYFVSIALDPGGNLGKARYLLRVLAPQLGRDLV